MIAHLSKGFGSAQFGFSLEKCTELFGKPEETEEMEGVDGSSSMVCHYWSKGFSLFFSGENNSQFVCVEVDNSVPLIMLSKPIFDLSEQQLIQLMKGNGISLTDSEQHEWGERRLSFDDVNADFYFEKGRMVSVNFSVPGK